VSVLVVKVGGAVADENAAKAVLDLVAQSHNVCVVHGAAPSRP
jgi:acetylglutamate kinase